MQLRGVYLLNRLMIHLLLLKFLYRLKIQGECGKRGGFGMFSYSQAYKGREVFDEITSTRLNLFMHINFRKVHRKHLFLNRALHIVFYKRHSIIIMSASCIIQIQLNYLFHQHPHHQWQYKPAEQCN